jgi:heme-degrading monooxygenase HmoA
MLCVLWEYEVRPGAEAAFEKLYGSGGDWAALFGEQDGYVGTELLRGDRPYRYLTIDRWQSERHYDTFLANAGARYARIDAQGDALTVVERKIGRFTTV